MLRKFNFYLLTFIVILTSSCAANASNSVNQPLFPFAFTKSVSKKKPSYRVWGKHYHVMKTSKNYQEKGIASWYGRAFHKRKTSSGERFNMYHMTAAHKTLPLPTRVLVTNLLNGRKVVVKVNDRGPFVRNRLIDLSYGAARQLGMVGRGVAPVAIQALA